MFSMRSYETNDYSITKDGNFQLMLSRLIASDFSEITVCLPDKCSDFKEFVEFAAAKFTFRSIDFEFLKYGANAAETRSVFWDLNAGYFGGDLSAYDVLITDITGYQGDLPFINNFNITKLPELERPYIDKFFDQDLASIRDSLFTTVINPRQREYILEVDPSLENKVVAYTKVAHSSLMPLDHKTRLLRGSNVIFWPFRISDKAYKFDEFLAMYEAKKLYEHFDLMITDPNDSYTGNSEHVTKVPMKTKEDYYKVLRCCPIVVMLDDIDTVLHPGTIEFFYYMCRVITFKNRLIGHTRMVDSIDDIGDKLHESLYNLTSIRVDDFYYSYNEVSEMYCVETIKKAIANSK